MATQPHNLIVISSDEMRGDCPSFMGNPDCWTPNLDRLAARGVAFNRHFTVHGKCVPSRIAMMTGRYSHTDAIRTVNDTNLLPPDTPSLLGALKAHNYETAYFGHNHVWEDLWGNNEKGSGCVDYHSFTHGYFHHLLEKKWDVEQPTPACEPIRYSDETINLEVERKTEPLGFFCDDNRAEQAIHYLRSVRDRSRPFYLHLNFSKPHPAYEVEEPYFSMYGRDDITPFVYAMPEQAPLHPDEPRRQGQGHGSGLPADPGGLLRHGHQGGCAARTCAGSHRRRGLVGQQHRHVLG